VKARTALSEHGPEGDVSPPKTLDAGPHFGAPETEALLVALTLSPATYSRNRFFEMYRSPEVRRARRRAGHLRSLVTALVSEASARNAARLLSLDAAEDGGAVLVYDVPSVGMRGAVSLRPIELSLVRYCVGRGRGERTPPELLADSADMERIGAALARLSPTLPSAAPSNEV
jgi:hypothetical protein